MEDKFMTKLDILGMRRAAKEIIESRFGALQERRSAGKIMAFESLDDLKQKDKEREKDGFQPKIKFITPKTSGPLKNQYDYSDPLTTERAKPAVPFAE